jgi:hypothetical protein
MSKRPAFQFYPSDWRNDPGLRLCSCGARGLWADMLCLMHEGEPYGHLTVFGRPIEPQALARLVGESLASVKKWLKELSENDVYSTNDAGVIFSRRMVRDEDLRERRAAGGPAGAEHGKKGAQHGSKGGRPKREETPHANDERGETKPPLKPPPSSSSSSSSVSKHSTSAGLAREPALPADLQAVMDESGITGPPDFRVLKGWYDLGADLQQDILPTIRKVMARDQGTRPGSLKYFTDAIREKLAADQAEIERLRGISRRYEQPEASGFRV